MSKIQMFEKPLGMRDSFPQVNEQKEYVRSMARSVLREKGYDFIKTPSLEYLETIGRVSAIEESALFKLVDNQGKMLVLRPDMTTPIARIAASKLLKEKNPLRLAYYANVFRAQQREGGRPAEFEQLGMELIGDFSAYGDCEVIYTAIELLKAIGLENFHITIGHAGLLESVLTANTRNKEESSELRHLLVEKNVVGYVQKIEELSLEQAAKENLLSLIENETATLEAFPAFDQQVLGQMKQLKKLLEMQVNGLERISFDFSLASHMSYYTGMLFEIYAEGSGFPIGNGGRYDELFEQFGVKVGATGFGIRVDRLVEVLNNQVNEEQHTLVLFDEQSFLKANVLAEGRRANGERVTLQFIDSVHDVEVFTQNFHEVIIVAEGGSNDE